MHRCYHPEADWAQESQHIQGEEAQHALKVMRMRVGDSCEIFDGKGTSALAHISNIEGSKAMEVRIDEIQNREKWEQLPQISLALAIPKGSNMELIVQKAVELGVGKIIPLISQRTIVRLKEKEAESKRQKWQRTALEACKQSGVSLVPEVESIVNFKDFMRNGGGSGDKICCAILERARGMREILEGVRERGGREITLLVGPEGDFTEEEYKTAEAGGYEMGSLGPIILRVETAVFMAMAQARYALD